MNQGTQPEVLRGGTVKPANPEGSINSMQTHPKPVYLSPRQKNILFELLDAVIGDKETTERLTWATDTEKIQLKSIRTEFLRCFTQQ